jgi:4-alpha-glucanotransferase
VSAGPAAALASPATREPVRSALERLGIRRFLLGIFDRSIPVEPDEDTGAGSPYGRGGARFLEFARCLGFDGLQLGPQGDTAAGRPSPYDAAGLARGVVALALAPLAEAAWAGLLPRAALEARVRGGGGLPADRLDHDRVLAAHLGGLAEALAALRSRRGEPAVAAVAERFEAFERAHAGWLEEDRRYEAAHGGGPAELRRFGQFVAHEQHAQLRARARAMGLRLYGDLPIGLSERDAWLHRGLVWVAYRMGAPPSRTNPEGQPWGYPVLDPAQPEATRALVAARFRKLFGEYDGVRIDHPHGYVCPWVYDATDPDPGRAVRAGARLFSSPRLPDHPALARFAIARPEQLNPDAATPRHADDWVVDLDDAQVARYGAVIEAILDVARENGAGPEELPCEVLSTLPYPLARVLARHGLGRFRITQKADLRNPADVYRSENAAPQDWILIGNHDTPPIWRLADAWSESDRRARAAYLAGRLAPEPERRTALAARLASDPRWLVQAQIADLFVGPARQVMIFFTDLFGLREPYNRPGVVSAENWSLRLPAGFDAEYERRAAELWAPHLPLALSLALRARGREFARRERGLLEALESRLGEDARALPR